MKQLASILLTMVLFFGIMGCTSIAEHKKVQSAPPQSTGTAVQTAKSGAEPVKQAESLKQTEQIKQAEPVKQTEKTTARYIGNKNSRRFHRESCTSLPYEKNRVYFPSREDAEDSYYKSCKKCNP